MSTEDRIPEVLFKDNHFLGRPADFGDKIVQRRLRLVHQIPNFCNPELELLDIGCGNGASMFMLSQQFKSCLGLEVEELHRADFEQYKQQHQIQNCDFQIIDIEKEQLPKQYDRIISFEVIEHLQDDKNVKFYYDTLKSGGMAAISVPNKWWIFETHGAKLPLLKWNRVPLFSWLPRFIHERYANARIYTKNRISTLLQSVGFEVVSMQYITAPLDVLKESAFKRFFTNTLFKNDTTSVPFLATSLFVVVKKN